MKTLAEQVSRTTSWRWLPGAKAHVKLWRRGHVVEEHLRINEAGCFPLEGGDVLLEAVPCLEDPATQGCIHAVAEMAYGGVIPMRYEDRWLLPKEYNNPYWYGGLTSKGYRFEGRLYPTKFDVYLAILSLPLPLPLK